MNYRKLQKEISLLKKYVRSLEDELEQTKKQGCIPQPDWDLDIWRDSVQHMKGKIFLYSELTI
jgi:hypothetical protein